MRRAAVWFLLTMSLPCQEPTWGLPTRGAAEYRRTIRAASAVAPSRAAALAAAAKDAVPTGVLPRLVHAPWLCQGELGDDQRAVGDEPRDLRDVMRAAAFDLRWRGQGRARYRRILPFGDLVLTGRIEPAIDDGAQELHFEVATTEPELRPGENKAALAQFVRPLCTHDASGTLVLTRTFDRAAKVVRSFRGELTLVYADGRERWRKIVVHDEWDLVAVHDNQDAAFRVAVDEAIRSGAKWIRKELDNGAQPYLKDQADGERSYGSGRLALALLTLLHCETPADDPVIVRGFDELARRELVDSYSLGVALMALAARHAPRGELEQLRAGVLLAPKPRQLSGTEHTLASGWLQQLLTNCDSRVDPAYRLRFNYVRAPRFDNSVNQYGLLGLYSARLCQIDVSATMWRGAANHLLEVQADDHDRKVRLQLTSYRELAALQAGTAGKGTRAADPLVPARGFAYITPQRPAYGSMTTAGLTGLVLARAGLLQAGLGKADIQPKLDAAIDAGFAWLGAEFHVRSNPGYVDRADDNWYYYLYGLERTCELAGVALLQGRDWYYEGALQLLAQQTRGGAFRTEHPNGYAIDATCFAVLFLKKATLPAVTGR